MMQIKLSQEVDALVNDTNLGDDSMLEDGMESPCLDR